MGSSPDSFRSRGRGATRRAGLAGRGARISKWRGGAAVARGELFAGGRSRRRTERPAHCAPGGKRFAAPDGAFVATGRPYDADRDDRNEEVAGRFHRRKNPRRAAKSLSCPCRRGRFGQNSCCHRPAGRASIPCVKRRIGPLRSGCCAGAARPMPVKAPNFPPDAGIFPANPRHAAAISTFRLFNPYRYDIIERMVNCLRRARDAGGEEF